MFDLFRAGIIEDSAGDAQSSKGAALICFYMEDAHACAPTGSRPARTQSSLALTMTRALGVLLI
jgi:hypothetical protein